ncbi:hypothetical protein [Kitasatospora sp. NPDC088351]|uniref:ATP-binding protein n=1 Tax=unclassified Kitasatospora TaxID=2633591 RepID=UPI0034207B7E
MPEALDRTLGDQFCSLPRHPTSAAAARILLRGFLSDFKGGEHYIEDAELIITELITAAVLRPWRPEHLPIDVVFDHSAFTGLRIEVCDTGLPVRERLPVGGGGSPGLRLVRELSADWGHELVECGTVTSRFWAHLAPPPPL